MSKRHALFTVLAGAHLVLVACGAAGWSPWPANTPHGTVLEVGRAWSGSDSSYGFFAPEVGGVIRARFTLIDGAGMRQAAELDLGSNIEARQRVNNVVSLAEEPDLRREVAASLASYMLGRYPEAQQVIVHIETYEPPTMDEYRAGARLEWQLLYEVTISR
jgi:hypothetical protein